MRSTGSARTFVFREKSVFDAVSGVLAAPERADLELYSFRTETSKRVDVRLDKVALLTSPTCPLTSSLLVSYQVTSCAVTAGGAAVSQSRMLTPPRLTIRARPT